MSYMRGTYYVWRGGDGEDEYVSIHAPDVNGKLPMKVFDQLVCMRFAEMMENGTAADTISETIKDQDGNFGCYALIKLATNRDPEQELRDWLAALKASAQ